MENRTKIILLTSLILIAGYIYYNNSNKNSDNVEQIVTESIVVNPEYVRSDPSINRKGLYDDTKKGEDISAEPMEKEDEKMGNLVKLNLPYLDLENDLLNQELLPSGDMFIS